VTVSSYPGRSTTSQGARIAGPGVDDLEGRHVLVVDDILDSGGTLRLMRQELSRRNPKSLRTCVLLRKERPSAMSTPCDYVGFDIPDVFVVGYGLDYNNHYRNLPDIGTLRKEAM
jgi:hypoxanthine phosphoribosyltransferase